MLPQQWETFKRAARLEKLDKIPMALIIDSPWIPGYLGIKHLDYLPRSGAVVRVEPARSCGSFPTSSSSPRGGWSTGWRPSRRCSGRRSSSGRTTRPANTTRSTGWKTSTSFPEYEVEADAFAALTLHRIGMHRQRILDHGYILADGHLARSAVHGGIRARHHAFHDRPGGESRRRAQADRPVHARGHRLAEGAAQGDGRHRGEHLHSRRHRRLHQRRALHGIRASVSEADLRRVPRRIG